MQRTSVRLTLHSETSTFVECNKLNMIDFRNHGFMVGGSFGFEMVRIIVNGVQSYRISDLINFCNTQSHQKNCFWKEIYQGAKLSLQRSLSSHRNHESLPFHFCHEIPSSRLPKDSSIPSRSSNRRSHTSRIHQNFSKKGKL